MSDAERGPSVPNDEQPESEPELFRDSFGVKELQNMLEEEKIDIEEVLRVIEQELQEPSPDSADTAATEEYKIKMRLLNELAQRQVGRSAALRELQERIDQKLQ